MQGMYQGTRLEGRMDGNRFGATVTIFAGRQVKANPTKGNRAPVEQSAADIKMDLREI